jgi:hypothetical protein
VMTRRKLVRIQHGRATVSRPRQRAGESDTPPSRCLSTKGRTIPRRLRDDERFRTRRQVQGPGHA